MGASDSRANCLNLCVVTLDSRWAVHVACEGGSKQPSPRDVNDLTPREDSAHFHGQRQKRSRLDRQRVQGRETHLRICQETTRKEEKKEGKIKRAPVDQVLDPTQKIPKPNLKNNMQKERKFRDPDHLAPPDSPDRTD